MKSAAAGVTAATIEPPSVLKVEEGGVFKACLAFDSLVSGHACGGIRLVPQLDEEEARTLAHAMTLKYGFLGLPQGGAKALVLADPEGSNAERLEKVIAFGKSIRTLLKKRVFIPATDIGLSLDHLKAMFQSLGIPLAPMDFRVKRSGYYAALTVFTGAKQILKHLGLGMEKCRVSIDGFGSVGSALAGLFDGLGAVVVAISTSRGALYNSKGLDVKKLLELSREAGSRVVEIYEEAEHLDKASLFELPADVLCPCAGYNSVHGGNAHRITARAVCAGANQPVTPEADSALFERGIVYPPYFMTNCGGVLGGTMEFASMSEARIHAFLDEYIGRSIALVLDLAKERNIPPARIAEPSVLRRFEEVRRASECPRFGGWLLQAGLGLYRKGLIPGALVGALSPLYFKNSLSFFAEKRSWQ